MSKDAVSVHIQTLGCARNEVDSEELAARLAEGGFVLESDPELAQVIVVNTCGFIEQAKKDSVDMLLAAADWKESGQAQAVVAVGCMAERYGEQLAQSLPEADAVLSFDDYADISQRLQQILAGEKLSTHQPQDRRKLLPLTPVEHKSVSRARLATGPSAPLKVASGCDRRCAYCAIPQFRGAYLSRPADEIVQEAKWLIDENVKELFLVSENTSSYGKDFGDQQALSKLLRRLSDLAEASWIRVSYLQPAEMRPDLVQAICTTPKVVPYFDLSFQHASSALLRRMRRFGDAKNFLRLIEQIRDLAPQAGIRSNFIVGFPGETEVDIQVLEEFLNAARLDAIGVFAYSDEENTEAADLDQHVDPDVIAQRAERISLLADELVSQRAEERIGDSYPVLLENYDDGYWIGRAPHQGPEVDGTTLIAAQADEYHIGDIVEVKIVANEGADLIAEA